MSVRTIWKNRPNLSPVVMLRANYVQARPQARPGPRNELNLACELMLAHAQLVQTISSSWNFQATSSMCSARQKGGWVQDARLSPHPRWPVVMLRANYVQARPQASPGPRNELSLACEPMLAHAQLVQTISSSWNFQATPC